ncbi:MAG: autotransporter outer membrane beta-barrel domain-containing protein [Gammaproteobacteria bacterium]|nr:autotransporter outer membrane beta-barrel domain-containing protein [Gammaproteobacteria bacterium]
MKNKPPAYRRYQETDKVIPQSITHVGALVCVCASLAIGSAAAQTTPLGQAGNTALQQATGDAVAGVCGGLAAARGGLGGAPLADPNQEDLFTRCNELAQTATGGARAIPGLSTSGLGDTLQQVATEEIAATGSLATESNSHAVTGVLARLTSLRTGGASGASMDFGNRLGFFVNGDLVFVDKDGTARENAFEIDGGHQLTAGVDYRFSDSAVAGIALSYGSSEVEFDATSTVASGSSIEADGITVSVFGSYYVGNVYFDALVGYGWDEFDSKRRIVYDASGAAAAGTVAAGSAINRTASATPDGDHFAASIGAGYDISNGGFNYGPYGRIAYSHQSVDEYTETGALGLNLRVLDQEYDSLKSVLGFQMAYASSQSFGILTPYARAEWNHEFSNNSKDLKSQYIHQVGAPVFLVAETDKPDRDYLGFAAGMSAVFKNGVQAFIQGETTLGFKDIDAYYFSGGIRLEF